MGTPEDIPEDREISHPCPECLVGNVTKDPKQGGNWQCDNCDWMPELKTGDIE